MTRHEIVMYYESEQLFPYWHANVLRVVDGETRWIGSAGTAIDPADVYAEAHRMVVSDSAALLEEQRTK